MNEEQIIEVKKARVQLDEAIQFIKTLKPSREVALAITNAQQSVMWLGMALKELGAQNPYPNSYNPANATIEPTADGLKL